MFSTDLSVLKGPGLEMDWNFCRHAWADLGLDKDRGRFLNFLNDPPQNMKYFYIDCGEFEPHSV